MLRSLEQQMGKKIRYIRTQEQLTQKQLAIKCGISKGYLSDIERGRTMPSFKIVYLLMETLGYELVFEKRFSITL